MADNIYAATQRMGYGAGRTYSCLSPHPHPQDERTPSQRFLSVFPAATETKDDYARPTHECAKQKSYLFISNQTKLADTSMTREYIAEKVRALTGHTPQCLRITCFTALSARYGPQYLVEAFGLSLTQASRYGNLQEFLLEEEVKQQREEFLELSRQLESPKKQHRQRSSHKK